MSDLIGPVHMRKISKTMINIIVFGLLVIFPGLLFGCGGGGGSNAVVATPQYGSVDGYVYIPVGNVARATAAPAGYIALQGAQVSAVCGSVTKTGLSNATGYFKLVSLLAGSCTISVTQNGFSKYQTTVSISANHTTTVGGTTGIKLSPNTSGSIMVRTNISGGEVIIDGDETNITIPLTLVYTFEGIAPGSHTVTISQAGYDAAAEQTVMVNVGLIHEISFQLNPIGNTVPTADAGDDANWFSGTAYTHEGWDGTTNVFTPHAITYTLDGSGSSDPDGGSLTYHWEQVSGPAVALSDETASKPVFVPASEGTYTFALSVSDGYLQSATDSVSLFIVKPTGKIAFESASVQVSYEIYTMNADGRDLRMMTERSYDDIQPHWSPDGSRISYSADNGTDTFMALINADGTGQTTTSIPFGALDWFPDGTILAWKYYSGQTDFYRINPDGTGEQRLTNLGIIGSASQLSADGTKIAFPQNFGGDNYEIMVMNSDGSNMQRLTNNNVTDLGVAWLPDGTLLYKSSNFIGDRIRGLYRMNADGTNVTQIPLPTGVTNIWSNITASSDGRFIYLEDQNNYLHIMYADGSASMSFGIWGSNPDYHPGP